ncbi:MAG: phosphatidylserine decarboxylase [Oscillospiraceae bacterium]|nr:phosphatidylserine decarboxylase [Oscillospiraceae bacterium]
MKNKTSGQEIWYYNDGRYEKEAIVAEGWMRFLYENPLGKATLLSLVKRKAASRLYGAYCRTERSVRMVPEFIEQNQIDMTGCTGDYKNFAEFFSREKAGISFPDRPELLGSPCEGLALAHTGIDTQRLIAAKGAHYSLAQLLGSSALAKTYEGGTMMAVRLTPANYHRAHFFDDGMIKATRVIDGDLYSVSPLALGKVARLYCQNKRAVTLFASQNFGGVALVEVGATFVGSIVHSFDVGDKVSRGQQMSYFLPGGSLLLMFFRRGVFTPNETLLEQTLAGYETKVQVGQLLGGRT